MLILNNEKGREEISRLIHLITLVQLGSPTTIIPDQLIEKYVEFKRFSIEEQLTHSDERIRKHAHPH